MSCSQDRYVSQVYPKIEGIENTNLKFSDFKETKNIILLGAPGAGKSYLFKLSAKHYGGQFLTVRSLLRIPANNRDENIYVDALDESRLIGDKGSVIDNIVTTLFESPPSKFRLSCREVDWLGDTDLAALNDYFEQYGGVTVLRLESLSTSEQLAILSDRPKIDSREFVNSATEKGLSELLENPQSLLLLASTVELKGWPSNRFDLMRSASEILMEESNSERNKLKEDIFSSIELEDTVGAIMSFRLISGVSGLCIDNQSKSDEFPSLRELTGLDKNKVKESIQRRIFVNAERENTVDYYHRTIAEYVAAKWLAKQVRGGLPLARLLTLLGFDGYPTSELRGLNAWLPTFLPEFAEQFISRDPYGVLLYGDPSSLQPEALKLLIAQLGYLAEQEPWFRNYEHEKQTLAGLISSNTIELVAEIILNQDTPYIFRTVLLEAVSVAPYLEKLEECCYFVLGNIDFTYLERSAAIDAISSFSAIDKEKIKASFDLTANDESDLRLKAELLSRFYPEVLIVDDFIALMALALINSDKMAVGGFWDLELIPSHEDILEILTQLILHIPEDSIYTENRYEVGRIYHLLLQRILDRKLSIPPEVLWSWLECASLFRRYDYGYFSEKGVIETFSQNSTVLLNMLRFLLVATCKPEKLGRLLGDFYAFTFNTVANDLILDVLITSLREKLPEERLARIYEITLQHLRHCNSLPSDDANYLLNFPQKLTCKSLQLKCEENLFYEFPEWQFEQATRESLNNKEKEQTKAKNIATILANNEAIEQGEHIGNLKWLAYLYYGKLPNIEKEGSQRERVERYFKGHDISFIYRGFISLLERKDLPSLDSILELELESKYQEWWYAILAGFDELWNQSKTVKNWTDSKIELALKLHRKLGTWAFKGNQQRPMERIWVEELHKLYPEAILKSYVREADLFLGNQRTYSDALDYILTKEELKPYHTRYILELISKYPANELTISMLQVMLSKSNAAEILDEVFDDLALSDLSAKNRSYWLATAFLIQKVPFAKTFLEEARSSKEYIWAIRELISNETITVGNLNELIIISASHFKNVEHPRSSMGDRNDWDGSEFVRKLMNKLSSIPTSTASTALSKLISNSNLSTYEASLKQGLANQLKLYREANFLKPTWEQTLSTLFNLKPSNLSDLHALLIDSIKTISSELISSNCDLYKQFWNEDSYGKITEPKSEESCRDVILELIRSRLRPLNIVCEPESHMINDKRVDIACYVDELKLPIEIKRDYHEDLWTSADSQLNKLYMKNEKLSGFGIYLVFWFGEKRKRKIKLSPEGVRPDSPDELQRLLTETLTKELGRKIEICLVDVSGN